MAIVEDLAAHFSLTGVLLAVLGTFALYNFAVWIDGRVRLSRLPGGWAPTVPSIVPFGLSIVHSFMRAARTHQNLRSWRDMFAAAGRQHLRPASPPCYTAETRILNRRILFTADPENIKAVLANQFHDYGKGAPFHARWEPFLGDSIFATDGARWQFSRQLLRPQFVRERVSDLETFERHIGTFFRCVAKGGALDGGSEEEEGMDLEGEVGGRRVQVCDVGDLFFRYTLDVATEFLLGRDVRSMHQLRQPFADAFAEVQRVQNLIERAGPLQSLVPRASYNKALQTLNEFVNVYIERALHLSPAELDGKIAKGDSQYTFLHALAASTRDRKVLRDQIVAVLLAGRDTTACTLGWAVYELARHPRHVAKLRREIGEALGEGEEGRAPTYADLKGMRHLQHILSETLRLYPVVPFNVRLALRDTTLPRGGGPDGTEPVAVLKDTPVGYSTLVMQRREDLYPPASEGLSGPGEWDPDRWESWQPKPWTYVPFNGGPRICIGQQFALTEMGYVLCRLFQRFERVDLRMDDDMDEHGFGGAGMRCEVVLAPLRGVRVGFWRAEKAAGDGEKVKEKD